MRIVLYIPDVLAAKFEDADALTAEVLRLLTQHAVKSGTLVAQDMGTPTGQITADRPVRHLHAVPSGSPSVRARTREEQRKTLQAAIEIAARPSL